MQDPGFTIQEEIAALRFTQLAMTDNGGGCAYWWGREARI